MNNVTTYLDNNNQESKESFYPTPTKLANKMFAKLDKNTFYYCSRGLNILEPSAGKGDLLDSLKEYVDRNVSGLKIDAIEIDNNLSAILESKGYNVIDNDFLTSGVAKKYDLIVANFPFKHAVKHLLKCIDIMTYGQIVCIINAETLKNPYSNERKLLATKLESLEANIEFVENAFIDAERKTNVEIAIVYINIEIDIEEDIFNGLKDSEEVKQTIDIEQDKQEVSSDNYYADLVAKFNEDKKMTCKFIIDYYKNYRLLGQYITLKVVGLEGAYEYESDNRITGKELTKKINTKFNEHLDNLNFKFWHKVMYMRELDNKLTIEQKTVITKEIHKFINKEFTLSNIYKFIINAIEIYPKHINKAIVNMFKKFTQHALKDAWCKDYKNNIHYFNAWKTNSGYKVNKKVIVISYDSIFDYDYIGNYMELGYEISNLINEIEQVFNYFDKERPDGLTDAQYHKYIPPRMVETLNTSIRKGTTKNINTHHFIVSVYKKGTIHLTFKNETTLRRFNIEACKGLNFLPNDYANRAKEDLSDEDSQLVENFEGIENYKQVDNSVFGCLQLGNSIKQLTNL